MTASAYIRQAQLDIVPPGIGIDRLRISFDVRADSQGDPPPSTITVTNLAETTAARLVRPATVRLSAGYVGNPLDVIYAGEITDFDSIFEGRDRLTTLTLASAGQSVRTAAILSAGYLGVVSLRTVVADIAGQLGLPVGPLDAVPNVSIQDYAHAGKAQDALTDLLRPRGVEWYVAFGELRFRRRGIADARIGFVLNEQTGMIGSPSRTERGATARMRLNALVRLNQRVRIESLRLNGVYKVITVAHVGDVWDGIWQTEIECVSI